MRQQTSIKRIKQATHAAAALATLFLAGCGGSFSTPPSPVTIVGSALAGKVYGGQQPVVGANIALYAASTAGYSAAAINLLTATVITNAGGSFTVPSGAFSCTAGQQVYLTATGGNPGGGTNPNLALMAALGECSTLPSTINVNEITTVGSVFALAPFMSSIKGLGTSTTNTSGLAHAFASVNKLVNIATGNAPGSSLPAGAIAPTSEIITLADILAACINSTGGKAGDDGTACGTLFNLTASPAGSAPTDTVQAALNIAHNPTNNVAALYKMSSAKAPFNPQLSTAPSDWTMALSYQAGGSLSSPRTTTVDASGNVWIANAGNNSVTVLAHSGTPLPGSPFTGNGLTAPSAVAIDIGGNAWIANSGGNTVSVYTPSGGTYSGSPFSGGGMINAPVSIAIDASGNIWIANTGNSTLTELNSAGTYIAAPVSQGTGSTATISSPKSLAIDPK